MEKILSYLKEHLKADFHLGFYLLIFTFLVISVIYNYAFHFKKDFIDSQRNQFIKLVYYFLFFGLSYLCLISIFRTVLIIFPIVIYPGLFIK